MIRLFKYTLYVIAVFFLVSCNEYIPALMTFNTVNTPNFTKKNQARINGYSNIEHGEGQFAYAATDHFGIMANSYFTYPNNIAGALGTYMIEGAAGYYNKLKSDRWHFDVYAGFGKGTRKNKSFYSKDREQRDYGGPSSLQYNFYDLVYWNEYGYDADYLKPYVQSSIYCRAGFVEAGFAIQSSVIYFTNYTMQIDSHYYVTYSGWPNSVHSNTYTMRNQPAYIVSPALILKVAMGHFSLVEQITSNIKLNDLQFIGNNGSVYTIDNYHGSTRVHFDSRTPVTLNIGLQFQFGGNKKEKSTDQINSGSHN